MSQIKRKTRSSDTLPGFTLIELLVVISIISLLASVTLVTVSKAREKARNSKRIQDIIQISKALELFYNQCNSYPALPSAIIGLKIDSSQSLFSGTAANCATNNTTGANGVLPNGGIGAVHTPGSGETLFVNLLPSAPTPIDDGSLPAGSRCSESNSQTGYLWGEYSYVSFAPGNPNQYWIYFCLSGQTGSYQAGQYILTERGIIPYTGNLFP